MSDPGLSDDDIQRRVAQETSRVSAGVNLSNVEFTALSNFSNMLKGISREAQNVAAALGNALESVRELSSVHGLKVSGIGIDTGGGPASAKGSKGLYSPSAPPAVEKVRQPASDAGTSGTGGGGGGAISRLMGGVGGVSGAVAGVANVVGQVNSMIDSRVAAGRGYSLSADRLSVMLQQIYGVSQEDVMGMRRQLTPYRLGAGGINDLLALQARTGISAQQQASSVEALRTLSGFSMSPAGATAMIESLAAPETVNRMFMMTGMALIGPGGRTRDTQSLIQSLAMRAGLSDPKLAQSAMAPGSITRANLSQMGVVGDLQEQVLNYARSNIEFRRRGGQGMYDPSNREHTKIMGIEDNFATEEAETERTRVQRAETFYRDQADSYASLERQTQSLTKTFEKLESTFKNLISARTETRLAQKIIGGAMMLGGAIAAPFSGGTSLALTAAGAAMTATGDGMARSGPGTSKGALNPRYMGNTNATPNANEGGSTLGLGGTGAHSPWGGIQPILKQRLQAMAAAMKSEIGKDLRATDGWRSSTQQRNGFLSRYDVTTDPSPYRDPYDNSEKNPIKWAGLLWKKVTRSYDMAPPGMSFHEMGLATDLDLSDGQVREWVKNNLSRFNLYSFANENGGNNEPHHIQPIEVPMSLSQYFKNGSPYGNPSQNQPNRGFDLPEEVVQGWLDYGFNRDYMSVEEKNRPQTSVSAPSSSSTTSGGTTNQLPATRIAKVSGVYSSPIKASIVDSGVTGDGMPASMNSPMSMSRGSSGVSTVNNFSMPLTINLTTNGPVSEIDVKSLAKKVATHIENEVNIKNIRSW